MDDIEIIAEIANAHQGDPKIAYEIALKAYNAGSDAIKYQIYFAEELLVKRHKRYEHFKNQSFNTDTWENLLRKTKSLGVKVYADIYGEKAFNLAKDCDIDGYKVHSSDINNYQILSLLKRLNKHKKIILSCGGTNLREIIYAVNIIKECCSKPVLMHGFQSYPTNIEDSNLERITFLKNLFKNECTIGFQDHISGDDPFSKTLPLLAIAKGAKTIEKHITLDRSEKGVDYYSSLEPDEFKLFVEEVKKTKIAFGKKELQFSNSEKEYRNTVKKKAVSAKIIKKGAIITNENIAYKRINSDEIETALFEELVGKKTKELINLEDVITRDLVENMIYGLIIVRLSSKRLPNKALKDINGNPAIVHLINRIKKSKLITNIILCTTTNKEDDHLELIAKENNIEFFRGHEKDVLGRMLNAVANKKADVIVRITGDDILVDPEYIDIGLKDHLRKNVEYTDLKELPSGTEVEIFNHKLLQDIYKCCTNKEETEYLTYFITKNKDQIKTNSLNVIEKHAKNWRLTLDTKDDYLVIKKFIEHIKLKGKLEEYKLDDIVEFFNENLDIFEINKNTKSKKVEKDIDTKMIWEELKDKKND